jgi:hypothetical protein
LKQRRVSRCNRRFSQADTDRFPTIKGLPAEAGSNGSGILPCQDCEGSYNCMKNGTLVCQVAHKIKETDFRLKQKKKVQGKLPPTPRDRTIIRNAKK